MLIGWSDIRKEKKIKGTCTLYFRNVSLSTSAPDVDEVFPEKEATPPVRDAAMIAKSSQLPATILDYIWPLINLSRT